MIVSLGKVVGSGDHGGEYSSARFAESNRVAQQRHKAGDRSKLSIVLKFMDSCGLRGVRTGPLPISFGRKEGGARKSAGFSLPHNKLYGDSIQGARAPASLKGRLRAVDERGEAGIQGARAPASLKEPIRPLDDSRLFRIQGARAPASLKAGIFRGSNDLRRLSIQGARAPASLKAGIFRGSNDLRRLSIQGARAPASLKETGDPGGVTIVD